MKKTLFAWVALLAGFATASAADEWTFSTASNIQSAAPLYGVTFSLGGSTDGRYTVSPDDVEVPLAVSLESIALTSSAAQAGTSYLYVVDSNRTLVAVSEALTYDVAATGSLTFTFDDATLSTDASYTAYFASEATVATLGAVGDTVDANTTVSLSISMGRASYSTANNAEWGVIAVNNTVTNNRNPYTPEMVITVAATPAVPEPATATLSLLALAGLAARRRRK